MGPRRPTNGLEGVRICILAKPPVPGSVNTRLAPAIGELAAARLALAFLCDTLDLATSFDWARVIIATTGPLPQRTCPPGVEVWPQGEGELGERLERVLARALDGAPAAIALGVDSPGLPRSTMERARWALQRNDAVIGPTADGGFYTLGLTRMAKGLLAGIEWSTGSTCRDTIRRLQEREYATAILPDWFDVDRPEDLTRLERGIETGRITAPHTAAALSALDL